jgi:hypothetical protein
MTEDLIILPLTYLGPVQYFSKFFSERNLAIEQYDNYCKQTYRNRCIIYGANGPVVLVIPVKRMKGKKNPVKDIAIDYETDWRRLHWRGIVSAYNSSPYFEFYMDSFEPYYLKKYNFLVDYCYSLTSQVLQLLDVDTNPALTEEYLFPGDDRIYKDFRSLIHPKINFKEDNSFSSLVYKQVFSEKFGFIPNLSIIDLLFNLGPEAAGLLRKSIKT